MMRKFAVALIATTMLVAPALAADAVKSTPAPVTAATTAAPAAASKTEIKTVTKHVTKHLAKTDKHLKTVKVAHRHSVHHMTFAKNGKHPSHVVSAKVTKPVKAVKRRRPRPRPGSPGRRSRPTSRSRPSGSRITTCIT